MNTTQGSYYVYNWKTDKVIKEELTQGEAYRIASSSTDLHVRPQEGLIFTKDQLSTEAYRDALARDGCYLASGETYDDGFYADA